MAEVAVTNGVTPASDNTRYDIIIIGAGFSGISMLYRARKLGLQARAFEAGSDLGGTWYWNRYPGARVDSEWPYYQLNIPEVWRDWEFSQRFPDRKELRRYFAHIDKVLDIKKDVEFNSRVIDAQWSEEEGQHIIKIENGRVARSKYLVLCSGLLHAKYVPAWPGLETYKGRIHHTSEWPEDIDVKGKRVAVIGAGATAIQVVSELSKEADHLTELFRRPSICLPMGQRVVTSQEQKGWKSFFDALFDIGRNSYSGYPGTNVPKSALADSPEEREEFLERIWQRGGFSFLISNYNDVLVNKESNDIVYQFWAKKVRQRIRDPKKQDLVAPLKAPYFLGTKRSPLEYDYYDTIDRDNVSLIDLEANPIAKFTETGIQYKDGTHEEFDVVALATGFDALKGSLSQMNLKSKAGVPIGEIWNQGIRTYLGMTFHGFPNTFMLYTPHAPTALSNGPTIIEAQGDLISSVIEKIEKEGIKSIEPTFEAEDGWDFMIQEMNKYTLIPYTSSWWDGGNVPGRKRQSTMHLGGINVYEGQCKEIFNTWKGFEVTK